MSDGMYRKIVSDTFYDWYDAQNWGPIGPNASKCARMAWQFKQAELESLQAHLDDANKFHEAGKQQIENLIRCNERLREENEGLKRYKETKRLVEDFESPWLHTYPL